MKPLKIIHNNRIEFYSNFRNSYHLLHKANNPQKYRKNNKTTIFYEDMTIWLLPLLIVNLKARKIWKRIEQKLRKLLL